MKPVVNGSVASHGFAMLYNDFILDHARDVGPGPFATYCALLALARGRPQVAASYKKLAQILGVSQEAVQRFLDVLTGAKGKSRQGRRPEASISAPWLKRIRRPRKTTIYEFNSPDDPQGAKTSIDAKTSTDWTAESVLITSTDFREPVLVLPPQVGLRLKERKTNPPIPLPPKAKAAPMETKPEGGLEGLSSNPNPNPPIDEKFLQEVSAKLGSFVVNANAELDIELQLPPRNARVRLASLEREHGNEVLSRVLWNFAERPEGFRGLHHPWSFLLSQLDTAVPAAVHELKLEAEEGERLKDWRCPEPGCGSQPVEGSRGWKCIRCGRPVDEQKAAEWRKSRETP